MAWHGVISMVALIPLSHCLQENYYLSCLPLFSFSVSVFASQIICLLCLLQITNWKENKRVLNLGTLELDCIGKNWKLHFQFSHLMPGETVLHWKKYLLMHNFYKKFTDILNVLWKTVSRNILLEFSYSRIFKEVAQTYTFKQEEWAYGAACSDAFWFNLNFL